MGQIGTARVRITAKALAFRNDLKALLLTGLRDHCQTPMKDFGLKLAVRTHFVITEHTDLELMLAENSYEVKFVLHGFFAAIDVPLITGEENFESDLRSKLIHWHLCNPRTIAGFGLTAMQASEQFLTTEPLLSSRIRASLTWHYT